MFCTTQHRHGFTLIELLVVVAILSVLLAILTPMLTSARYQAQIVQCVAVLRGVGFAQVNYATENVGRFPAEAPREETDERNYNLTPWRRAWALRENTSRASFDLRPTYREYLGGELANTMLCPLAPPYFADSTTLDHGGHSQYSLSPYMMYTTNNWRQSRAWYADVGAYERLGRSWSPQRNPDVSFTVLASDYNIYNRGDKQVFSGHPGPDGFVSDDSSGAYGNGATNATNFTVTYVLGHKFSAPINFVDGDCSVRTYTISTSEIDFNADWYYWSNMGGFGFVLPMDLAK
jgi:prepilin-type N-terminal cleavage/methylation domain-containing protein